MSGVTRWSAIPGAWQAKLVGHSITVRAADLAEYDKTAFLGRDLNIMHLLHHVGDATVREHLS